MTRATTMTRLRRLERNTFPHPPSAVLIASTDAAECKRLHIAMKAAGKLLPGQDVILVATGVPRASGFPSNT
jgi:hypothetical protein